MKLRQNRKGKKLGFSPNLEKELLIHWIVNAPRRTMVHYGYWQSLQVRQPDCKPPLKPLIPTSGRNVLDARLIHHSQVGAALGNFPCTNTANSEEMEPHGQSPCLPAIKNHRHCTVSPGFKTKTFVCGTSFIHFRKSSTVPVKSGELP